MSDFKPIETQDALDQIIKERLKREQEKFADYEAIKTRNKELETEVNILKSTIEETSNAEKSHEQIVADLNKKIAEYETASLRTRIALQNGLPIDLADRLVGDDEESIKADAERLAGFVSKKQQTPPPLKNIEKHPEDSKDGAYKSLIENLNVEGE
ncbi:capsid assembly scaffolding protein Gp46 family protein [Escherichia coli]